MTLTDRVRAICVSPTTEWPVIAGERGDSTELVAGYLAPLAAVGAVAGFIGSLVFRSLMPSGALVGGLRSGVIGACLSFAMAIAGCGFIAFTINALAPAFGGRPDFTRAFRTSVYAYTPGLVAGVLQIFPVLGFVMTFIASIYGIYLLYLGLPVMMQAPKDKTPVYTLLVVAAGVLAMVAITFALGVVGLAGTLGSTGL